MKLEDAPAPGWYPDPERTGSLRWWEGTDWTDDRRALQSASEAASAKSNLAPAEPATPAFDPRRDTNFTPRDTERIVSEVREAARQEVTRAADLFSRRAQTALSHARSVVAEYVSVVLRWVRIAIVVVAIAVIVWFALQFIVQAAFLDWIGDRIDNLTDN